MDEIKNTIKNSYKNSVFTSDDIKELCKYCDSLIQNEEINKKQTIENKQIKDAFVKFINKFCEIDNKYLNLFCELNDTLPDLRIWHGYYIGKRNMHVNMITTPYLCDRQKSIYLLSVDGNSWFSDDKNILMKDKKKYIDKFKNIKASDLFCCNHNTDCERCSDIDEWNYEDIKEKFNNDDLYVNEDFEIPIELIKLYIDNANLDEIIDYNDQYDPEHFEDMDY